MSTLRTIGVVAAGFLTVVVLSTATDFILESLHFFPPQNQPNSYTRQLLLIALVYRCVYTVAGGYVTARLATENHMRYVVILGIVGMVAGTIGVVASWSFSDQHWYPIALVITALPCAWLGGKLRLKQ